MRGRRRGRPLWWLWSGRRGGRGGEVGGGGGGEHCAKVTVSVKLEREGTRLVQLAGEPRHVPALLDVELRVVSRTTDGSSNLHRPPKSQKYSPSCLIVACTHQDPGIRPTSSPTERNQHTQTAGFERRITGRRRNNAGGNLSILPARQLPFRSSVSLSTSRPGDTGRRRRWR